MQTNHKKRSAPSQSHDNEWHGYRRSFREELYRFRHDHSLMFAAFTIALTALVVINTLFIYKMIAEGLFDTDTRQQLVYPSRTTSLQLASNSAISAQVRNVTVVDTVDPMFARDPSMAMLVMELTVRNKTNETQHFIPVNHVFVRSEDGTYSALTMTSFAKKPISAAEIAPGEAVTGDVSFAIPKSAANPLMYVDTGWNRSVPLVVDVLH